MKTHGNTVYGLGRSEVVFVTFVLASSVPRLETEVAPKRPKPYTHRCVQAEKILNLTYSLTSLLKASECQKSIIILTKMEFHSKS